MKKIFLTILCSFVLASMSVAQTVTDSITHHGITWNLQEPTLVGTYATGDYWAIGPLTVVSVTPTPTGARNGSMLNPRPVEYKSNSAWDDRIPYSDMSLQVSFPVFLNPGDSLMSCESHQENHFPVTDILGVVINNHCFLKNGAVLTVVDDYRSPFSFRPPYAYSPSDYAGGKKPEFSLMDLKWERLPKLLNPGGAIRHHPDSSLTSMQQLSRFFERPWFLNTYDWVGRQTHPSENMPNYYREAHNVVADAALMLCTDASRSEKLSLLVGFIQVGIDSNGCGLLNACDSSTQKLPTLFAGRMLDKPWLLRASKHNYKTDEQTYLATNPCSDVQSNVVPFGYGWTGATVLWRQDDYCAFSVQEHEGFDPATEWQTLNNSSGGGKKREIYRRSCSFTYPGAALAAYMIDVKQVWNHPPFFAYVDRWMTEYDVANMAYLESLFNYNLYISGQTTGSGFVSNMWNTYRSDY